MSKIKNDCQGHKRNPIGILGVFVTILLASLLLLTASSWAATPKIAGGGYHTIAIKSDGTLWAWGRNQIYQLGDGTTNDSHIPKKIGSDTDWVSIATGFFYTIALRSDGTLWAWGYNNRGQLGLGDTTTRISPIQIGSNNNWVSITAGYDHTIALKSDGTLWAWGHNDYGQLGDNSTTDKLIPTQIGSDNNWVCTAAGYYHTIALKSNGTLWAWGNNTDGQLGDNTTTAKLVPTQIGSDTDWVSIAAGFFHTIALKSNGTLWTWGGNDYGQLGDTSTTDKLIPTQIGSDTNWVSTAAGGIHTIALKSNGTLWTWGGNDYGQLGDNSTTDKLIPTQIGSDNSWVFIAGGGYHTITLKSNGELWAWGRNDYGQLGDNTTTQRNSPVQITTVETNWVSIAAGGSHTIALKSGGTLWAWGWNLSGQLGDGTTTDGHSPTQIGLDNKWVSIAAGYWHTIALKSDGTLWAWGYNNDGELGDGTTTDRHSPTEIGLDNKWVSIAAGDWHTIALKSDGTLWAWGDNYYGELGDGTTTDRHFPTQIGLDNKWVSIAAGGGHTIALKSDGTLWAWGYNYYGELGDDTTTDRHFPTQIGLDNKWVSIAAGTSYTIALKSDGTLWAWGYNSYGQLGDDTTTDRHFPTQIGLDNKWVSIAAGGGHTIALKSDGTLWAWGANYDGQLGDGTTPDRHFPTQIGLDNKWVSIAAGTSYTIALKSDGTLWAWGDNYHGQLGDDTTTNRYSPVRMETFTINATAGANGSISPSGAVLVNYGYNQSFTIIPNPGYHVADVLVDGSSVGSVTSYPFNIVTANHTISASFATNPTISGTVTLGGSALPGVTMSGLPGNPLTDVSGFYTATVDYGWTGTVTPTLAGYTFSPSSSSYANVTINQTQDYTATLQTFTLTVTKSGTGSGTVTSSPSGINCGSDCTEAYANGTPVTLTATPDLSSTFSGWSGSGCIGTGTCTVIMDAAKTVNAQFDQDLIDRTIWADLEVVRRINNGGLESELRRYGSNGSNYLHFYDPTSTINSFQADVTVKAYENNGSYPHASLLGYAYKGTSDEVTGDVIGVVGIGHNGTELEGFWSISKCIAPNCNLPNEIQPICSGRLGLAALNLNIPYTTSFSWNGSSSFTFSVGGSSRVVNSSNCTSLPTYVGPPDVDTKGIGTRVTNINAPNEAGYIAATFDNVHVNGGDLIYDDFATGLINPAKWRNWEFVRAVSNGELVSALTQRGENGSNNMSFVDSQHILGFEADLKVVEFQNTGARPQGRLYAALYNDGTSSGSGDLTGDVTCSVGILERGSGPEAFYAVSRCTASACNLSTEYEILTSGIFGSVGLNETHKFSLSWDGSQLTFGLVGFPSVSYIPTVPVAGPPKGRKGIGTRVSEIQYATEWAYVAAAFDNVVVLSTGYPLTVAKSGTGNGTVTSVPPGIDCGSDCGEGYPSDTPVTLTATPAGGSFFAGWSGGGCSGTGSCLVTMDAAKSVTATFTINTYTVTASVVTPAGGSVTPPLSQTVNYGSTATFTVITNAGYTASVSEGTLVGTTWTIPNVTSTHTATVTFTIVSPPPTIISITPNYGFVGTVDNFYMINGTGFLPGATVKLTKGGQSDIIAAIDVITSTQIRGRISLSVAAEGLWNVVITNPDSQSYALTNGFTVNPLGCPTPATPSSPSPSDGATGVLTNQTLSWAISAETDSYDVYFGTSTNPLFLGNVIGTSYALPTLNPNTTYYWKIVARNNCGNSSTGSLWSFTTLVAKPAPPVLALPGNGETGVGLSPTLSWNASNGASSYWLQVSTDNFSTFVFNGSVTGTSQTLTGPLLNDTTYSWRVNATNAQGTSAWSDVWTFVTQPPYGNIFIGVRGVTDPDNDGDGIDDDWEKANLSDISPNYKTLFVRPKQEIGLNQFQYWPGFIALFPDSRPGFANIPPLTNAGIEVVVIGAPGHKYAPFDNFNYDPATDPNHPNCDILELKYKKSDAWCAYGSQNSGHTFFSATGLVWSWDTKGYTPSTPGIHGYKTPEVYPYPLDNYLKEGAYSSIAVGQTPGALSCSATCTSESPMNVNAVDSVKGLPDATVEFNPIAFDSSAKIISITEPLPSTGYDRDTVLRRTTVHEMGHALLAGLDSDHCADPKCIMYASVADWQMHDFGPGNCTHMPGGSKDIRAYGVIHNSVHGVVTVPAAPVLASPSNVAVGVAINPTLSWNASSGATSYGLQVSTTSSFSTTVVNQSTITSTSYPLSGLANSTTFYWRVNATNSGGTSDWSTVWSFTTAPAPPAAPTLASPANGATGVAINPTLSWNASAGATSYGLQVSTTSSFSTTVVNQTGIQNTSYPASGLANSTTYYWRVNATNAGGTSAWSAVRSFTTVVPAPPAAPTLVSPADGATGVSRTPTLTWSPSSGATSYRVQVSTSSSFSTTVVNQSVTTTSYTIPSGSRLSATTRYYWRVNATNAGGTSAWSSVRSFTTTR